jgi:ATP-dependent NAD(P)H-hydrate dehydratase
MNAELKKIIPPLSYDLYKGQSGILSYADQGRILVYGGSEEYTGAPYFAAATALKLVFTIYY